MDYQSNSHKSREGKSTPDGPKSEEREPVERVTTNPVTRRKKSLGARFKEIFVGGDSKSVFSYIMLDVIVPATKETITDALTQGVERMVFGESRSPRSRGFRNATQSNSRVSYNGYSSPPSRRDERDYRSDRRDISNRARAYHDFGEILIETRVEADEVINRMMDRLDRYALVTVGDLYDLVGIDKEPPDEKYGWVDERDFANARVVSVRGGYKLDIPRPEPID